MNAAQALILNDWLEKGGFAEAVIRMALAGGATSIDPDAAVWKADPRLTAVPRTERAALVAEQASIVRLNHTQALDTLPVLVAGESERAQAFAIAQRIGTGTERFDTGVEARIRRALELPVPRPNIGPPVHLMHAVCNQTLWSVYPQAVGAH